MSEEPPSSNSKKGLHTLGGDGEPAMERSMQKMQMRWTKSADGEMVLIIRFVIETRDDGSEDVLLYAIMGDELFKFYQFVREGMEGRAKRPSYLG